mmetsp:Transcript_9753/g.17591  ORF Transcript_9753/g.17591 Transcript_9753/m.17591 type:complete len:237 (+) Transcript_9753:965-1675(+)
MLPMSWHCSCSCFEMLGKDSGCLATFLGSFGPARLRVWTGGELEMAICCWRTGLTAAGPALVAYPAPILLSVASSRDEHFQLVSLTSGCCEMSLHRTSGTPQGTSPPRRSRQHHCCNSAGSSLRVWLAKKAQPLDPRWSAQHCCHLCLWTRLRTSAQPEARRVERLSPAATTHMMMDMMMVLKVGEVALAKQPWEELNVTCGPQCHPPWRNRGMYSSHEVLFHRTVESFSRHMQGS